ncbi:MAG: triacylglycerol lipase [Polyangiales bacterium]
MRRLAPFVILALCLGCGSAPAVSAPGTIDVASLPELPELPQFTDASAPTADIGSAPNDAYTPDATAPNDVPVDAPDPRTGPPYPIVLVHGFAGFTSIGPINYFFNVARDLRSRGETVIEAVTTPFSSAEVRGPMLAPFVDMALRQSGRRKVILIAHSQGGLDARYLISSVGYGDRVAALVTVSTPHHGTRLGDVINGAVPGGADVVINIFASVLGAAYNTASGRADIRLALSSMSEATIEDFNRDNPDDPRVTYWSWAGRSNRRDGQRWCPLGAIADDPTRVDSLFTPLLALGLLIENNDPVENVNDGLVSVRSARWGRFMGCVPADHFDEIGQIAHTGPVGESGFDHVAFYRDVVRRLRAEGL